MTDKNESYKDIFKATSLFGGVQVFIVLIGIIRNKIIAVLLDLQGMGLIVLFERPLGIISLITEMGLGASSIRDIAKANANGDEINISRTIKTVRRWVWMTGLTGMLVVIALSPLLSKTIDGKTSYTWAFILLSVTLLFSALSNGQTAILRGLRRLKDTAKVSLFGSSFGLILSVPIYYLYGIKGIVPTLIITALFVLLTSWYFSSKIKLQPVKISYKESFYQGKDMIKLGIIISMSNLISQIVSYVIPLFITYKSGVEILGLFEAGWKITNQYVAVIFTAMTVDYFPRLISLQSNREKMSEAVNHQAEIAILIIAPLMLIFISFLPIIVHIIYKGNFLPIIDFVQWMILGMLLKTASWALSHIIVAKGDNRLFFLSELFAAITFLLLIIIGYTLFNLMGIGIAFVLHYSFYLTAMIIIAKKKYQITFTKDFNLVFLFQFLLCFLCFITVFFKGYPLTYIVGPILFIISSIYSFRKLNDKLELKEKVFSLLQKRKSK